MFLMYSTAILAVMLVGYMLVKRMDIKIALYATGIVLMFVAIAMGNGIAIEGFESTNLVILDPILAIVEQFKSTLNSAGFIILVLGGYSAYMTHIGANQATVNALLKPINKIKSVYVLVPVVFLLGNLLSLVVPSASNLSIILLATLYPVLHAAGMSTLTIAGVIATTATVMPTPLGGDNVAIASELATTTMFSGITPSEYVFNHHALVSIPTLLVMAIAHYFWQKYRDDKDTRLMEENDIEIKETNDVELAEEFQGSKFLNIVYSLLPVLPIILLLIAYFLEATVGLSVTMGVEVVTLFSFVVAILFEIIRHRDISTTLDGTNKFFTGMGNAIEIVALLVAASTFVIGLQSIGLIDELQSLMMATQGSGSGFVLPLILVAVTVVIVLISGSGTALFYAMVPLMVPLAAAAAINPLAITVPMGLAGNLMRAVSPVAAVVMIVSGTLDVEPIEVVKRTSVPMILGVVFMFVLSMIIFL